MRTIDADTTFDAIINMLKQTDVLESYPGIRRSIKEVIDAQTTVLPQTGCYEPTQQITAASWVGNGYMYKRK